MMLAPSGAIVASMPVSAAPLVPVPYGTVTSVVSGLNDSSVYVTDHVPGARPARLYVPAATVGFGVAVTVVPLRVAVTTTPALSAGPNVVTVPATDPAAAVRSIARATSAPPTVTETFVAEVSVAWPSADT